MLPAESRVAEVVADKGYHSNETMVDLAAVGVRSYIEEPVPWPPVLAGRAGGSGCGVWEPPSDTGQSGQRRGELLERTVRHLYDTGGMRGCTCGGIRTF